jgi:prefoldin subunit 5
MVALAVHRALQASVATRQEQKTQQSEDEWNKCLEGLDINSSELEQQWAARVNDQDARVERLIHMVDALADNVINIKSGEFFPDALMAPKAPKGLTSNGESSMTDECGAEHTASSNEVRMLNEDMNYLREQVEEMEAKFTFLYSSIPQLSNPALASGNTLVGIGAGSPTSDTGGFDAEGNDSQHHFSKLSMRMDVLQESRDDFQLSLQKVHRHASDNTQRIENIEHKCHEYFPRIKELALKLTLFQTKFTSHQDYTREAMDSLARGDPSLLPTLPPGARLGGPLGNAGEVVTLPPVSSGTPPVETMVPAGYREPTTHVHQVVSTSPM